MAAGKPFSFPGNSCCLQQESHSKILYAHSSTTLNYNVTDFHWGGEMHRIQPERKEHLLDLVGDKEVNIKNPLFGLLNNWHLSGIFCT